MRERVIAFVPAYNEEKLIAGVLKPLMAARERGLIQGIVVVDDGSSDRTADEAARALGGKELDIRLHTDGSSTVFHPHGAIIRHAKNLGKMAAFKTAAGHARAAGADILFMTDADMLNLTAETAGEFLSNIVGKKGTSMITADYRQQSAAEPEGFTTCDFQFSGFRAIRMDSLNPLLAGNKKWAEYFGHGGFGLEAALEILIPAERVKTVWGLDLVSRGQGAGATDVESIRDDIDNL
jgi:glycosyltransferase involved in cell wall biosynthesis